MENIEDNMENMKDDIENSCTSSRCPECGDPIEEEPYSNINKSKVYRNGNKKVAIKKFRNATSISSEFLNEVRNNLELNYGYCNLIYGVTRDPQNGEFAIVIEFQNDGNIRELVKKSHTLDICKGERPPIPEYTPEPYAALMKRCWDPIPTNRPSVYELGEKIAIWCDIIHELSHSRVAMKQEIEKEFSREREDRWKARLAELATKPFSLKKSQNMLTSKQLDYSKQLTQLLEAKDVEMETNDNTYHTRQFDMSLKLLL
ncbi:unnamed protein product [Rhizophagus irregularis]|nr:unnamed protein product [Rhizophagus irregularis]